MTSPAEPAPVLVPSPGPRTGTDLLWLYGRTLATPLAADIAERRHAKVGRAT